MALANSQPETPAAAQPSTSFLEQAKKLDQELRETWRSIQKDMVRLGQILLEMKNKRMHIALGYQNFEKYVQEACGHSKTQAFEAMRIVRELTTGPGALSPAVVSTMSRANANRVIWLREHGIPLTRKIVQAAQTLSEKQFLEEIRFAAPEKQGVGLAEYLRFSRYTLEIPQRILDQLLHAHELLKACVQEADSSQDVYEKAWEMMAKIVCAFLAQDEEGKSRWPNVDAAAAVEAPAATPNPEPGPTPEDAGTAVSAVADTRRPKRGMRARNATDAPEVESAPPAAD